MIVRFLVGVAAVAVIGFVGVFAYERIDAHLNATADAETRLCLSHVDLLAEIESGDVQVTDEQRRSVEAEYAQCSEKLF